MSFAKARAQAGSVDQVISDLEAAQHRSKQPAAQRQRRDAATVQGALTVFDAIAAPERDRLLTQMHEIRDGQRREAAIAALKVSGERKAEYERRMRDASIGKGELPGRDEIEADAALDPIHRDQIRRQWDVTSSDRLSFKAAFDRFDKNQPFDPNDNDDRKNADRIFQSMGGDDGALTALIERTGIFPDSAAIKMRGDLISDDPERVAAAMSRATKAIAINPDALSNVEGGAELESRAGQFRSLVGEFGMTPAEAANRMVREEKPELADNQADLTPDLTDLLSGPDEARRAELRRSMRENVIQAGLRDEFIKFLLSILKRPPSPKPPVPAPRGDRVPGGQSGGKSTAGQQELKELVDALQKLRPEGEGDVQSDEPAGEGPKLPDLPAGAKIKEKGIHGPIIEGLAGRWRDLVEWMRRAKTGDALAVLSHEDVPGPIDVIWGKDGRGGFGLAHILEKHPDIVSDLPERLTGMRKYQETAGRIRLTSKDGLEFAIIAKHFDRNPKRWLLTAYGAKPGRGEGRTVSPASLPEPAQSPVPPGKPNIGDD